jgi:hypothetical protein
MSRTDSRVAFREDPHSSPELRVYTEQFETFYDILLPLEHCKSLLKCRKWHFRDSSFETFPGGMPPESRTPLNVTKCAPPPTLLEPLRRP